MPLPSIREELRDELLAPRVMPRRELLLAMPRDALRLSALYERTAEDTARDRELNEARVDDDPILRVTERRKENSYGYL